MSLLSTRNWHLFVTSLSVVPHPASDEWNIPVTRTQRRVSATRVVFPPQPKRRRNDCAPKNLVQKQGKGPKMSPGWNDSSSRAVNIFAEYWNSWDIVGHSIIIIWLLLRRIVLTKFFSWQSFRFSWHIVARMIASRVSGWEPRPRKTWCPYTSTPQASDTRVM